MFGEMLEESMGRTFGVWVYRGGWFLVACQSRPEAWFQNKLSIVFGKKKETTINPRLHRSTSFQSPLKLGAALILQGMGLRAAAQERQTKAQMLTWPTFDHAHTHQNTTKVFWCVC